MIIEATIIAVVLLVILYTEPSIVATLAVVGMTTLAVRKFKGGFDIENIVTSTVNGNVRYISRIHGKSYWCCMDKLTDYNYSYWSDFASEQSNPRRIDYIANRFPNFNGDGSQHFSKSIRENYKPHLYDVYVCYITKTKPDKHTHDIDAKDILIFMTVVTSPGAVIATHVGISLTETGMDQKQLDKSMGSIAIPLHAFAAQAILSFNPSVRLMINAPSFIMESIILKALPDSTYIGTVEMRDMLESRKNHTIQYFEATHGSEVIDDVKQRINKHADDYDDRIAQIDAQGVNHPRVKHAMRYEYDFYMNSSGFQYFGKPIKLRAMMAGHPPVISMDTNTKRMIVYAPGTREVIADFSRDGDRYGWMFNDVCRVAGNTHYIAVDYDALANAVSFSYPGHYDAPADRQ